jgi:hypothetical protein
MDAAVALLAFVTLQRFVEFIWDRRNTRRLRAAGAVEFGGLHYPAMMLVHAGWLAGLWLLAYDSPVIPGYVAAFLVLQVGRYWVLATLGPRWCLSSFTLALLCCASRSRIRLWRGCRENTQGMGSKARAIEGVHGRKRESARTGRALSSDLLASCGLSGLRCPTRPAGCPIG